MIPSRPPTLDTLTIMPDPRDSIRGSRASVRRIGAKKLTRMTSSASAGSSAMTLRRFGIAALLISTSMPPSASHARRARSSSADVSARSATNICDPGAVCRQSASTSSSRSRRRAISPTTVPRAASSRASAAPNPDEAPVMSTRLPATAYAIRQGCRESREAYSVESLLYRLNIRLTTSDRGTYMTSTRYDGDTWDLASSVGVTATMVAAARAMATRADNPLINDPFAEPLVKLVGVDLLSRLASGELDPAELNDVHDGAAGSAGAMSRMADNMAVRTKFFDEFFLDATNAGIKQAVILASGLDARPYRLAWPADTVVYEVDQPQVIEFKTRSLADLGAAPTAERRVVAVDLRDDWPTALRNAGFDPSQPTAWSAEGLLGYLPPEAQDRLLDTITELSAPGSRLATESAPNPEPGDQEEMKERMQTISERWRAHGFELDMAGLVYFGDRNEAAPYLADRGWRLNSASIAELFAANGLDPLTDDDVRMGEMLYTSGTLEEAGAVRNDR